MPPAKALLADRGYDADWFRDALADRRIEACIPSNSNRKIPIPHDRVLYRKRHRIENMFGKLKRDQDDLAAGPTGTGAALSVRAVDHIVPPAFSLPGSLIVSKDRLLARLNILNAMPSLI